MNFIKVTPPAIPVLECFFGIVFKHIPVRVDHRHADDIGATTPRTYNTHISFILLVVNAYRAQQPVSYSCRHDSHTPDSARLSGKIPQAPQGAEDFSTKPAGPGLASVRKACGYLRGENRHRAFIPPRPLRYLAAEPDAAIRGRSLCAPSRRRLSARHRSLYGNSSCLSAPA